MVDPINLGSSELVTINQLVDIVEEIAGIQLKRHYNLDAPKGVRGRNSDNTLILERLGWEPRIPLAKGWRRRTRGSMISSRRRVASLRPPSGRADKRCPVDHGRPRRHDFGPPLRPQRRTRIQPSSTCGP